MAVTWKDRFDRDTENSLWSGKCIYKSVSLRSSCLAYITRERGSVVVAAGRTGWLQRRRRRTWNRVSIHPGSPAVPSPVPSLSDHCISYGILPIYKFSRSPTSVDRSFFVHSSYCHMYAHHNTQTQLTEASWSGVLSHETPPRRSSYRESIKRSFRQPPNI